LCFLNVATKEKFELQQTFAIINVHWGSSLLSAYGRKPPVADGSSRSGTPGHEGPLPAGSGRFELSVLD
jgi:hypothetical protein